MFEIMGRETVEGKIRFLAEHYSKKNQLGKAKEELMELLVELDHAREISADIVVLPENAWSEVADVFIMIFQLVIQHGKEENVRRIADYKLSRQIGRILLEDGEKVVSGAKTRQSEFLKLLPNAPLNKFGNLKICPAEVDKNMKCRRIPDNRCLDCRKEYWLAEVED